MDISTDPALLSVDLPQSMNTSPSVSTFLPDEEASMYPLLPTTPSPPPHFNHPLTTSELNDNCAKQNKEMTGDDARAEETSSCSGSSGIGMDVQVVAGTTTIYNQNVYQHLGGKNGEQLPESETKLHANLNLPDSKDVPSFVYWNWKLIRQCSFLFFIAAVFAMVAIVVSMIYSLPRTCNPKYVLQWLSLLNPLIDSILSLTEPPGMKAVYSTKFFRPVSSIRTAMERAICVDSPTASII